MHTADIAATRARLDRRVLVSCVVSGLLFLVPLAFGSLPLALVGLAYVVGGAVFLSAVYARDVLTRRQELIAWAAPWVGAVLLWAVLVGQVDAERSLAHWLFALAVGLVIATPAYVAWQAVALAVSQLMAWRSSPASSGRASAERR